MEIILGGLLGITFILLLINLLVTTRPQRREQIRTPQYIEPSVVVVRDIPYNNYAYPYYFNNMPFPYYYGGYGSGGYSGGTRSGGGHH